MALWKRIAHIETDFSEPDLPPLLVRELGNVVSFRCEELRC